MEWFPSIARKWARTKFTALTSYSVNDGVSGNTPVISFSGLSCIRFYPNGVLGVEVDTPSVELLSFLAFCASGDLLIAYPFGW